MTPRRGVWYEPTGSARRLTQRIIDAVGVRTDRVHRHLRGAPAPASGPRTGPAFPLSGYRATFAELEAIMFDSDVLAAIERRPSAHLSSDTLPEPDLAVSDVPLGPPRLRDVRIVDLVPFGLELDILELRLAHLYDLVDTFVVVESSRGYGGIAKPLVLQRNLDRFARFAPKLLALVVDDHTPHDPHASRTGTDWGRERAARAAMWTAARPALPDADTIVITSDCDELPPRHLLQWIRRHEVALPLRVRVPTLRFNLGWRDPRVFAEIVVFSSRQFPDVDAEPGGVRALPGPVVGVTGGVHLTSFLNPLALIAKFAMTTDWEEDIVPYLRNANDETRAMVTGGHWFGRPMRRYRPEEDVREMVPETLRLHNARFAHFWPD